LIFIIRLLPVFLCAILPLMAFAEEPTYIGIEQCRICHMPHYNSWDTTKMSKAYELLKPGARKEAKIKAGLDPEHDYSKEEQCLPCHVTGYKKPGGFVSMEETPDFIGVQCEMCHGPGSIYAQMMLKKKGTYTRADYMEKGGLTMPSEENNVCVKKCHNPKSPFVYSLDFKFEDRKAIGTHRHDLRYIDLPFDL